MRCSKREAGHESADYIPKKQSFFCICDRHTEKSNFFGQESAGLPTERGTMTPSMKRYEFYKPSGVAWLGDIPAHWEMRRVKTLFSERIEKGYPKEPLLAATQSKGVVTKTEYGQRTVEAQKDLHLLKLVKQGDFVISLRSFEGGIEYSYAQGIISPAYTVLKLVKKANDEFFKYFLKSSFFISSLTLYVTGIREGQNIEYPRLSRSYFPFPPLPEQQAIVRYLDHATRKIDRAVRTKKKLIAALNEQKQAIIAHAVTRGLDPNVPMKESGVAWLGEIPAHWEMIQARYLFRSVTRKNTTGKETKLSVTQKRGLIPTDEMRENSTQAKSFDNFQLCEPDDLVLNKYKAHLGVFWAAPMRGLITPNYTVFKPIKKVSTKFYELVFHTEIYKAVFTTKVYGVTEGMSPLYTQDFYNTKVPFPSYDEQMKILEWIDIETATINKAIELSKKEIELLQEYKTRLIADVVTGAVDVRKEAQNLPQIEEDSIVFEDDAFEAQEEEMSDE